MGEILRVENLTKEYKKGVVAVNSVNFSVNEGEIFALIGPNGAGKTSTIRMISTLITPTGGDAFVDGHSIIKEPDKVRQAITYLPDEAGAYKTMTGMDYLYFMAGLFSSDKDEIDTFVNRGVNMCGLGDRLEEKIGGYSRGMIRKLLLSRAVMTRPRLAILDEATSGLDGMSFLLSSHNMLEIEYVSDRVGIMAHGKIMAVGTIDELKQRYEAANLEEVFERVVTSDEVR